MLKIEEILKIFISIFLFKQDIYLIILFYLNNQRKLYFSLKIYILFKKKNILLRGNKKENEKNQYEYIFLYHTRGM
jgi:hypothetical protein